MTAKKYLPIAIFIGAQAAMLQILDQLICGSISPIIYGGGWIAFQAWAVYFLAGCTVKGGARGLIGYGIGVVGSIVILSMGGALGSLGFWAMPLTLLILVPVLLYLDIAPEMFSFVPAVFVGAGVFFGIMTYVPNSTFTSAAIGEMLYCLIGLAFGWLTITFRGWYEGKYVKIDNKSEGKESTHVS